MKDMKTSEIVAWILFAAILIYAVIITWQWMQLRKNIAKVATKTPNPSSVAISSAVKNLSVTADAITTPVAAAA